MKKSKDLLFLIPFALIIIFGGLTGYLSFIEALNKTHSITVNNIAQSADNISPQITRKYPERVKIKLEATSEIAEFDDGKTFEYWTFNKQVPGPFIRVRDGDTVEISLTHLHKSYNDESHRHGNEADLMRIRSNKQDYDNTSGHEEHSIDLHATLGFMGGAELIRVAPGEMKSFEFKATRPGLYVYHCGSAHAPTHIARGMYGMILVEPKEGLPKVDKEYYVMQGELYTKGDLDEGGFQEFSRGKLLNEQPEYYIFNGKVGALIGDNALTSNTGDTVRIFFGNAGQNISSFHIIGGIFDSVYTQGDLTSTPLKNVQTTLVPAGGSVIVETTTNVPGKLLLVDHSLTRAIDRGAVGEIVVTGEDRPDLIKATDWNDI